MHKLTHVNMFHIGFRKVRKVGYAPMIGICAGSGLTACIVSFRLNNHNLLIAFDD